MKRTAEQPRRKTSRATEGKVNSATGWFPFRLPLPIIVLCVFAVFGRILGGQLLDWDDDMNVTRNVAVMHPSFERIAGLWTHPYSNLYVPLVYTSYIVDLFISRGGVWMLHLSNLLLHCGAAICVFILLQRLVGSQVAALAGALLFALHPLQAEPVSWVTGRKDVLSGSLMLLSLVLFDSLLLRIRAVDAESIEAHARKRNHTSGESLKPGGVRRADHGLLLVFAFVSFGLALFSKPSALMLPVLVAALAVYRQVRRKPIKPVMGIAFGISALWVIVNAWAQSGLNDAPFRCTAWKRPFLAADCLVFYLRKLVVPVGLAPMYPRSVASVFETPIVWFELPALAGLTLLLVRHRKFLLAWSLWVIPVLPVLGLTPFLYQWFSTVADRYVYVSMAGAGLAFALGFQWIETARPRLRVASRIIAFLIVAICAGLTFRQAGFWKDSVSLWTRELRIVPRNVHALYNLSSNYLNQGRQKEAIEGLQRALEIDKTYAPAYTQLMIASRILDMPEVGRRTAEQAIQNVPPNSQENYVACGNANYELGYYEEAAKYFDAALHADPNDLQSIDYLGMTQFKLNDNAGAELSFRHALTLNDQDPHFHAQLARALVQQGRIEEAKQEMRIVLQLNPGDKIAAERMRGLEELPNAR